MLSTRHIIEMSDLSTDDIMLILDTAESFKEVNERRIKKLPTLRGRTVVNLFLEPSTRTRTSFELAAKRLSADGINFSASTSATVKGESLVDTAETLAHREQVEQRLRRVLVHPVAAVDDVRIHVVGEHPRTACVLVPDDDEVTRHRREGLGGIDERLALDRRARRGGEVDAIRREPLGGNLEARARSRARLEEEVHDCAAAKRRELLDPALVDLLEGLGRVEDEVDLVDRQVLNVDDVLGGKHCYSSPPSADSRISTESRPSMLSKYTFTRSLADEGTFLPTKSARIGSSLCPRSTSTASWIE